MYALLMVPKSTTLDDLEGSLCTALCFKKRTPWCCYLFIISFIFSFIFGIKWLQLIFNLILAKPVL